MDSGQADVGSNSVAHNSRVGIPMLLRYGSWRNPFEATKSNVGVETRRIGYLMKI